MINPSKNIVSIKIKDISENGTTAFAADLEGEVKGVIMSDNLNDLFIEIKAAVEGFNLN